MSKRSFYETPGFKDTIAVPPPVGAVDVALEEIRSARPLTDEERRAVLDQYVTANPATPAPTPTAVVGRKDDTGKVRMELLSDLPRALEGVAKVLTWAVTNKKPVPYEPGSWLNVADFHNRYKGAMKRHENSQEKRGKFSTDLETGLLEAFHIATNALFLAEKIAREIEERDASSTGV